MEKEANQLYRRPQMTGKARDEEEEEEELNTPSDGNGLTGIHSAAVFCPDFFNEMGNKKKEKWGIKRRKNVRKLSQLHAFSFFKCKFETFLMTAKAMCICIKVRNSVNGDN